MREKIIKMLERLLKEEKKFAKMGNGNETVVRRITEDGYEWTLVGDVTDVIGCFLYMGHDGKNTKKGKCDEWKNEPATVSRIQEGRREDRLLINGVPNEFASLMANNIKSVDDFHFCV